MNAKGLIAKSILMGALPLVFFGAALAGPVAVDDHGQSVKVIVPTD